MIWQPRLPSQSYYRSINQQLILCSELTAQAERKTYQLQLMLEYRNIPQMKQKRTQNIWNTDEDCDCGLEMMLNDAKMLILQ